MRDDKTASAGLGLDLTRRAVLGGGTGLVLIHAFPVVGRATPEEAQAAIAELFPDASMSEGRVSLELPPIAENGFSVPLSVSVDSPMTLEDHVRRIAIISERNPDPKVAQFHLGPRAGKAAVSTRIRLAGTQTVRAVAEMSDGSLWSGTADAVVTLAACVVL